MKKTYTVSISYLKFKFDSRGFAMDFADDAFDHLVDKSKSVELSIEEEDETGEEEEDEADE